ncbi:ribonuclease PH [Candidatus Synechococcus calcipolaris G9]|uniref:Ribonuclease PH n=1 Tax=Candidatus Synechococcus calcipolaris G9 TaxID=1497997 RepID=A0ABT6EYA0_9SYNE|nr:ribonuclease PH [Candidatus Synechococcus calcipolaris]MDG2990763.1 ribonuclease PH [Candidatus Synechococcus calcipolaris G9]
MGWQRPDGRQWDELRSHSFQRQFTQFAPGSVLARCGQTQVLCNVSIREGVPRFLEGTGRGWLTAEYRMLPGATPQRQEREWLKLSGRTQEIQRLIGRSLRAALDFSILGERTLIVDADVLQADAGTRTTAITGSFIALADAIATLLEKNLLQRSPLIQHIAAVSIGLIEDQLYLDLNYPEDVAASVDFNVVMTESLELLEVQGTAEDGSFSRAQLLDILDLAEKGIKDLILAQKVALES